MAFHFSFITEKLKLRTYGQPIVHETGDTGKKSNHGYDALVQFKICFDNNLHMQEVWREESVEIHERVL